MSSPRPIQNFLAGPYLDRRSTEREAADWHRVALADPHTQFVIARGTAQLLHLEPEPRIAFLDATHDIVRSADPQDLLLLGWFQGSRTVLVDVDAARSPPEVGNARFEELRPLSATLAEHEASLLAYARALIYWRQRHRFCGLCASAMRAARAGHAMLCSNADCAQEVFPRLDPAIIVLVTDQDRALLGRQASWPPGRYSTIAGFVEPGESLEDAVAREVMEETGVPITDARYESSQPWPFPSSLMLGFYAIAQHGAIACHDAELEDARWFTRADIASGTPLLPPPTSISYRLIETWFNAGSPIALADAPGVGGWDGRRRAG